MSEQVAALCLSLPQFFQALFKRLRRHGCECGATGKQARESQISHDRREDIAQGVSAPVHGDGGSAGASIARRVNKEILI
jgi:hypothetical protein